jgi:predicted metal-dependent phosphoesterase TrpH
VRIDLHTHSRASDGTQSPRELVRAAADAGLDVLALTDHDTADGWNEAVDAADEVGLTLVRGMELSTRHHGRGVHLLAYLPDPTWPPLVRELDRVLAGRDSRVPGMVEKLRGLGIDITVEDVRKVSGEATATGRPHVADALVAIGAVGDRDEAFARYLASGRPAYTNRYATPLTEMIRIVREAGGVSVVAHPWGRGHEELLDAAELGDLAAGGLAGVEVDHQDHDAGQRARLRGITEELGLVVTGSSDHHGAGKSDHELGCNTTDPEEYLRLLDLAATASARSGRRTPGVAS